MSRRADRLLVHFGEAFAGTLHRERTGLTFEYDELWRTHPDSFPLSYSMPLDARVHHGAVVSNYLWGLLPDNDDLLRRWAGRFGVNRHDAIGLLTHMGEDCAGSATFTLKDGERAPHHDDGVDWLNDEQLCARITDLAGNALGGRLSSHEGQFSLAGAQSKTALRYDPRHDRWGVPRGKEPTTEILKPAMADLDNQTWNEHFCLSLAREVGLTAAKSRVIDVCGHAVLVVERFDRVQDDNGGWERLHQEDMCQALGTHPANKYERDGGPGIPDMVRILDSSGAASADRIELLRAVMFNMLIAGTDAHAKNFGILWDYGSMMRLAPLYDINSALPYTRPWGSSFDAQKLHMAMRVGGHYKLDVIHFRHIEQMAQACKIARKKVLREFEGMVAVTPDAVVDVSGKLEAEGAPVSFLGRISSGILDQCSRWESRFAAVNQSR